MPPLQVLMSFIGIIVVLIAAYYATYYIGMKASGRSRGGGKGKNKTGHIKILERFAISKDKSFCIVEIAGKVYIVGVTNQAMTLLDTLEAAQLANFADESGDAATRNKPEGGPYSGKYVNKLAAFIAQKTGRTIDTADNKKTDSGTFAESMQSAREKKTSEQPRRVDAGRQDGSEGKE